MKQVESFNVQIWVGLREDYSDFVYGVDDVRIICDEYCNRVKQCVTITPTEFRYVDGSEKGVIVGFINYPRFPSTPEEILKRALELGQLLKDGLKQNRVSITTLSQTYMLEND